MKLFITRFSSALSYFLRLWSKYSSHHSVLKHPQSMLFPLSQTLSFTPIQNNSEISFVHMDSYKIKVTDPDRMHLYMINKQGSHNTPSSTYLD
jgi:hypothetical protein